MVSLSSSFCWRDSSLSCSIVPILLKILVISYSLSPIALDCWSVSSRSFLSTFWLSFILFFIFFSNTFYSSYF